MISILGLFGDWALLILRAVIALIFLSHGLPKIKNLKETAGNFAMMGFKPGVFWGTLVAAVEVFGGLAVAAGLFTQVAALLFAIHMTTGVIWKIKNGQKLIGGFELDMTLAASSLVLLTFGSGLFGLDNYFGIVLY